MNRFVHAFMRFIAVALLATAFPAAATIDAPDHIYYGSATLFGLPAPNGTVVEARADPSGEVLRRYVIGSNSHLGGQYALHIPMDQVEPRTAGRARPGDPIKIFLGNRLAGETSVGAVGVATRLDLDPQNAGSGPAITITDVQVYEGQAGHTQATMQVTLNTTAPRAVAIHWETRNGPEVGGAVGGAACGANIDFVKRSNQTLTIAAGQLTGSIAVQVCGDTLVESNEVFSVELLSTVDDFGVFEKSTAQITIQDDDNVPTLAVANVLVAEPPTGTATARFLATLSRAHENPVSFTWTTQNVSANAGSDYVAAGGTVTIPAGDITAYLDVTINADAAIEPDETFRLAFSAPVSLGLPQTFAYGTIVDPRHDPALEEVDAETGDSNPDFANPSAVTLTPDGLHAYGASYSRNAVLLFGRDPATGALSHIASYKVATSGFAQAKLQGPQDVKVSPDGAFVYIAAEKDNAITVLARDAVTGVLTFQQNIVQGVMQGGVQVQGLQEAARLAISPDGAHVYALGRASNAIATFSRDATTGQITFVRALTNASPGMAAFSRPGGLAVSPDGKQVYATARFGNALLAFDRNATAGDADFGKLSLKTAYVDGLAGISGLKGAFGVALSPDGKHLYVAAENDNNVVLFDRAADGALTQRHRFIHGGAGLHGLIGAQGIEVAPDGREVFVTGNADDSLTIFRRRPSNAATEPGKLSVHNTVFNGDNGLNHLSAPGAMASSGDNRFLYVAASGDNGAVVVYRRLSANVLFQDDFETVPAMQ